MHFYCSGDGVCSETSQPQSTKGSHHDEDGDGKLANLSLALSLSLLKLQPNQVLVTYAPLSMCYARAPEIFMSIITKHRIVLNLLECYLLTTLFIPEYKGNFETHLEKPHEDSRVTHDGEYFGSEEELKTSPGIDSM